VDVAFRSSSCSDDCLSDPILSQLGHPCRTPRLGHQERYRSACLGLSKQEALFANDIGYYIESAPVVRLQYGSFGTNSAPFLNQIFHFSMFIYLRQSRYVSLKMKPKGRPAPPCQCPDEATFLRLVPNADGQMHPGHTILPQLFDNFTLEADDTTGFRGYECIVTNVLGQSVQTLSCENRISLPWDTMKQVVFSILLGLDYLHSVKGVLHGGEVYYVVPFFCSLFCSPISLWYAGLSRAARLFISMNYPDLKPDNILLGLPDNPDKVIEKFLASLDSSQDTSGPITITRPNTDMLDIRLTDLDLGELFSDIFTRLLTLDLSCYSSFIAE
jgi:serine/threonine protein kinase